LTTKDFLKKEIDSLNEEYVDILLKLVKSWMAGKKSSNGDWKSFISSTYGSFSDEPLERYTQG